jgi:diguanylate cyclase
MYCSDGKINGNSRPRRDTEDGAADSANGSITPWNQTQSDHAIAEVATDRRSEARGEQELAAASRKITALKDLNRALRVEKALLVDALAKATRLACHDELTGLPNRHLLQDHFNQAVARAARQHSQVVLLFVDLNGFKHVNDEIGHLGGDLLLQQVAGRLTSCIRASDTACRFGGDEFVVLLADIGLGRRPKTKAKDKIISQLTMPYVVDATTVRIGASIGMATYPTDGTNYDELMRFADFTMYRNKVAPRPDKAFPKPSRGSVYRE